MTNNVIDLNRRRHEDDADGSPDADPPNGFGTGRAVYSVGEVAQLLNLALGGTYALVRSGEIPARKLGGRWVIPKAAFHAWLDDCTTDPDADPGGPVRPLPGQRGLF